MIETIVLVLMLLFIIALMTVIYFGYRYIKFILSRHFYYLEKMEKVREKFQDYETSFYTLMANPVLQTEIDFKRASKNVQEIKSVMIEFEELFQSLPENRGTKDGD